MARRIGRLPRSLDGVLAVPSQRLSTLLSMIDKVFMLQHSCRAVAGSRHVRSNEQKKHGKRLSCSFAQSCFSCLRGFVIEFSFCSYIFKAIPEA